MKTSLDAVPTFSPKQLPSLHTPDKKDKLHDDTGLNADNTTHDEASHARIIARGNEDKYSGNDVNRTL